MKTTSRVIAEMLKNEGIDTIFGLPGGQNVEFMEQARQAGLEFVLVHREGNAAFMADIYGQVTGRPGVCMSTLGPGSTNLVNGVANAFLDRSPMLAITGQISTRLYRTFTHQNINHERLFAPITKWTTSISANATARTMRKALRLAVDDRPGPVHIDLLSDIAGEECTEEYIPVAPSARVAKLARAYSRESALEDVTRAIDGAKRPVILAGIGVLHHRAHLELQDFAQKFGLAVVTTPKSKGVFPEDSPLFAGVIDMAGGKLVKEFIKSSDLLLAVGFDAVELINDWDVKVPTIHIDAVANTDQIYQAGLEIVGDLQAILAILADLGSSSEKWNGASMRDYRSRLDQVLVSGAVAGKLNPHEVVQVTRGVMPKDTIITYDIGSHKNLVGQVWKSYYPRTAFVSNGLSTMGFSFPGAVAAQMLCPGQRVVCFTGDGGFAMGWNELETAVRYKTPVITVVFADGCLNRIVLKQQKKGYPLVGTTFNNPNLAKLAESFGAFGAVAETPGELQKCLEEAAKLDLPSVIEARVDPSEYGNQF